MKKTRISREGRVVRLLETLTARACYREGGVDEVGGLERRPQLGCSSIERERRTKKKRIFFLKKKKSITEEFSVLYFEKSLFY